MAGTYSQLYIQIVFAVNGRKNMLHKPWRSELFKYMAGIINGKGQKVIIVNGVSDHVHIFVGLKPSMAVSDLVRDVKNNSTNFINRQGYVRGKFSWQAGFGTFSYGKSQVNQVYEYILHQEKHHLKTSFHDEYHEFLRKYEIEHEDKYLFEWVEECHPSRV